jgi:hypothetical protein
MTRTLLPLAILAAVGAFLATRPSRTVPTAAPEPTALRFAAPPTGPTIHLDDPDPPTPQYWLTTARLRTVAGDQYVDLPWHWFPVDVAMLPDGNTELTILADTRDEYLPWRFRFLRPGDEVTDLGCFEFLGRVQYQRAVYFVWSDLSYRYDR